jgi:hypothetical protein
MAKRERTKAQTKKNQSNVHNQLYMDYVFLGLIVKKNPEYILNQLSLRKT